MADAQAPLVTLDAAAPNDAMLLGNLMELYSCHSTGPSPIVDSPF